MKQLCALLIILLLTGCASTRHAATYQTQQDSTYFSKHRLDSLFAAISSVIASTSAIVSLSFKKAIRLLNTWKGLNTSWNSVPTRYA